MSLRKEKETILAGAAIAKDELVRLEARVSSQENILMAWSNISV